MSTNAQTILDNVGKVSADFAAARSERQLRRHLDKADFDAIAATGFLLVAVPESMGGIWTDISGTTRPICEALRMLAQGDPSVALVCAMHPAVLAFWLCRPEAPEPYTTAWAEQSRAVEQTAVDGAFWGTITSEPGSGGDVARTKAVAKSNGDGGYLLSGEKHFGSGSGLASYMVTTAIPEGEESADWFFLDMREARWDGSNGMRLRAEWDGHGMIATQSHAFVFEGYPATRLAWPGSLRVVSGVAGPLVSAVFSAVVYGVVQAAAELARRQLARRKDSLAAYESVEWARVENEAWVMERVYKGMLESVERKGSGAGLDTLHAKITLSELAESVTARICRIVGGGTFHRSSPFGAAFEDVRALGFLRPPWVLAYDQLLERIWQEASG